jgi:uncharacterized protein (TIGR02453 family)
MKASVVFFQKEFIDLLSELKNNNNREWFKTNKETFQEYVDQPFKTFVGQLLDVIHKQDQSITIDVNDAIFRLHRDLRFSEDKSPYKTYKSALISTKGRRDKTDPGFYLEMSAQHIKLACGCFKLKPSQVKLIEKHIEKIYAVSQSSVFISYFGELIQSKTSQTFEAYLSPELIKSEDLDILILTHWQLMKPVISIFKDILSSKI